MSFPPRSLTSAADFPFSSVQFLSFPASFHTSPVHVLWFSLISSHFLNISSHVLSIYPHFLSCPFFLLLPFPFIHVPSFPPIFYTIPVHVLWFSLVFSHFISFHFLNMFLHLPPNSISLHFLSCPFVFFYQFPPIPSISLHFLPAPLQILFILFVSFGFLLFPVSACHVPSVLSQFLPFPFIPLARQMKLGHWLQGPEQEDHSIVPGGGPTLSFYSATPFEGQLSIVSVSFHFLSCPFISLHFLSMSCHFHLVPSQVLLISLSPLSNSFHFQPVSTEVLFMSFGFL